MAEYPYDDLEKLVALITRTFTGDTNSVAEAANALEAMGRDPLRLLNSLIKILMIEKNDEETLKIKNAATITITKSVMKLKDSLQLPAEIRSQMIRMCVNIMFADVVSLAIKVHIQVFLMALYAFDTGSEMVNEGLVIIKERFKTQDVNQYPPAFLLLQAIISVPRIPQESIANWLVELTEPLITIGGGLAHGIISEISQLSTTNNAQNTLNEGKITSIFVGLKILNIWLLTMMEFIKLLSFDKLDPKGTGKCLRVIAGQEQFVQVFIATQLISLPTEKQLKDCIFSMCGNKEIDHLLNTIKYNITWSFNRLIDPIGLEFQGIQPQENCFLAASKNMMTHMIMSSVKVLFKHENLNLDELLMTQSLADLISESLEFLSKMIRYPDLTPIYSFFIKDLIVDVTFSLLKTTKAEAVSFTKHPDSFITAALDACATQSSGTPKAKAAKLLTKICRHLDGAMSYVVLQILSMIDYSMVSDKREDIPEKYKDLADHINSNFIARTDPTTRVETCLFILSVLSSRIARRRDLINMVEELLNTYQGFFITDKSDPIIRSRVCLLFSFYCHFIFEEDNKKELYLNHLRFLLECAGLTDPGTEGLVQQACHSLSFMLEKEYLKNILGPFIGDVLQCLSKYVLTTKANKVFDIIYEIVDIYFEEILQQPQLLIDLVNVLVERGKIEIEAIKNTPKDTKYSMLTFNKVWNIIRNIGETEPYILQHQEAIENALIPLFDNLDSTDQVDCDEDILNYVASATRTSKKVSPICWRIFQSFPKIFTRSHDMMGCLFPALNAIIVYGYDVINQDKESISIIIEMGIRALKAENDLADEATATEAALLFQAVLQYLQPITHEQIGLMLKETYDVLINTKADFLRATLGGVFLCSFMKDFNLTQQILAEGPVLDYLLALFLKEVKIFDKIPYDRKVLIIGLSSFLPQENLDQRILDRFFDIFDIIFSLLRYVEFSEQKDASDKIKMAFGSDDEEDEDEDPREANRKEKLLMDFLSSEKQVTTQYPEENKDDDDDDDEPNDDDDDDEDFDYESGKIESNALVKNFITELQEKDEFLIFKEAVFKMKEIRLDLLKKMVEELPPNKRAYLTDVLQSQRVATVQEGRTQARKIVKSVGKKLAHIQLDQNNGN